MTAVVNLDTTLPRPVTCRVVDVDARMPELPAIATDPALEEALDLVIEDLRDGVERMRKRRSPSTDARALMLGKVLSQVHQAKYSSDPMASLVQYLDELTATVAEVREVIDTVGDLIDE